MSVEILSPKQMLQRLSIALAQVQANTKSGNFLNEIGQVVYSLYRAKEITTKVYDNNEFKKGVIQNGYYFYEF